MASIPKSKTLDDRPFEKSHMTSFESRPPDMTATIEKIYIFTLRNNHTHDLIKKNMEKVEKSTTNALAMEL